MIIIIITCAHPNHSFPQKLTIMNVSSKLLRLALVVAAAIIFQVTEGSSVIDTCAVAAKNIKSSSDSGGSGCGKRSTTVDSFFTCN